MIDLKYKPTITGGKIILRPFKFDDLTAIEMCLNDPEVSKFTGSFGDQAYDKEKLVSWYTTRNDQHNRLDLAIINKSTDELIGEVVINSYEETDHSMNFRILIGSNGRNQGFGTEATRLIIDYIFNNTDLKQLTLSVFAFNPRARRVYEKIGFILHSVDENDLEFEGVMIDSINMVLSKEAWKVTQRIKYKHANRD